MPWMLVALLAICLAACAWLGRGHARYLKNLTTEQRRCEREDAERETLLW